MRLYLYISLGRCKDVAYVEENSLDFYASFICAEYDFGTGVYFAQRQKASKNQV